MNAFNHFGTEAQLRPLLKTEPDWSQDGDMQEAYPTVRSSFHFSHSFLLCPSWYNMGVKSRVRGSHKSNEALRILGCSVTGRADARRSGGKWPARSAFAEAMADR